MKLKTVLLLAVLGVMPSVAHASIQSFSITIDDNTETYCKVTGTTILLETTWQKTLEYEGQNILYEVADTMPLQGVQPSTGPEVFWHCTGAYTAGIFWKDESLGICSGTAQAEPAIPVSCDINNNCSITEPGRQGDYVINWNNPACGP